MKKVNLWCGDCMKLMQRIPDYAVDCSITDPPYGMTQCVWDVKPDLNELWQEYKRVVKPDGAIAVFSMQPFTSELVLSNREMFKYEWIWEKTSAKGHLNAKRQPLRAHENIEIFYRKQCAYHPIKTKGTFKVAKQNGYIRKGGVDSPYGKESRCDLYCSSERYPRSVQRFSNGSQQKIHFTQKPVSVYEYLIRTYTSEGQLVLDSFAGSMTCAIAAISLNRRVICIEQDADQFSLAAQRVRNYICQDDVLKEWYDDEVEINEIL